MKRRSTRAMPAKTTRSKSPATSTSTTRTRPAALASSQSQLALAALPALATFFLVLVLVQALVPTRHEAFADAAPAIVAVKRGEPLSRFPAKSVDQAVGQWKALDGQTVKIAGVVKSVCQQKGCWFVLAGKGGEVVRITSMGYKFFVPTNTTGKEAVVEGKFGVRTLAASLAQHYEEDRVLGTAEKPKQISEPVKEFTLAATAVEIR